MAPQNHLRPRIKKTLAELARHEKRAIAKGAEDSWHELRTNSRRLRGFIHVLKPWLAPQDFAELDGNARLLTKVPAKVRDLDVALKLVADLEAAATGNKEKRAAQKLSRALQNQREKQNQRAQRRLRRERSVKRLVQRLITSPSAGVQAAFDAHTERRATAPGPHAFDSDLAVARTRVARALLKAGGGDIDAAHKLRLAVKKLRNITIAVEGETRRSAARLRFLKDVQDLLGSHHDLGGLERALEAARTQAIRRGQAKRAAGYSRLIKDVRSQREEHWQEFQTRFASRLR